MSLRNSLALAGVLTLASVAAAAQNLGGVSPDVGAGKWAVGGGYNYADTKWKLDNCPAGFTCNTVKVKENHFYFQGDYGFSDSWQGWARLGVASSKAEVTVGNQTFSTSYDNAPAISVGAKGSIYSKGAFSTGPAFQYTWYAKQKKTMGVDREELDGHWDGFLGWGFQGKWDTVAVYGGPQLYRSEATSKSFTSGVQTSSDKVKNKDSLGAYAGVAFSPDKNWRLNFEIGTRAGFTAALGVRYAF